MSMVLMMLGALSFPVVCLGFLLWLNHLEETLPAALSSARREPAPAPILALPVRDMAPPAAPVVVAIGRVPQPRPAAQWAPERAAAS